MPRPRLLSPVSKNKKDYFWSKIKGSQLTNFSGYMWKFAHRKCYSKIDFFLVKFNFENISGLLKLKLIVCIWPSKISECRSSLGFLVSIWIATRCRSNSFLIFSRIFSFEFFISKWKNEKMTNSSRNFLQCFLFSRIFKMAAFHCCVWTFDVAR